MNQDSLASNRSTCTFTSRRRTLTRTVPTPHLGAAMGVDRLVHISYLSPTKPMQSSRDSRLQHSVGPLNRFRGDGADPSTWPVALTSECICGFRGKSKKNKSPLASHTEATRSLEETSPNQAPVCNLCPARSLCTSGPHTAMGVYERALAVFPMSEMIPGF